ncbi:phosphodiester glycosidase family protein [Deinococcus sp. HMF7604]|uniref:phosphodiester glycosidase family protein n=1 Tax=Deinococcus betulae TaxID=2873312 RepID=UPI001CC91ACD|nr:phosphodiester glycosidase family protein [Deinococcus betulae]MBZ9752020.1 phosphodiester glycosidase family protein [Deinococcus betulae]
MLRLTALLMLIAAPTASALTVQTVKAGGVSYTVATVMPARDTLRLHWLNPTTNAPYTTFEQLRARLSKEGRTLLFATNSGIYAPGLKPLGLHIEKGQTLTPLNRAQQGGNFALVPNGVFWLKGEQAGVTETRAFEAARLTPDFATQSGPLLVQKGVVHPQFRAASTSFKLRSGVGVCQGGAVKFALSSTPVNFYSFATFFRDTLSCPDALYLDGSISAVATQERSGQFFPFAGIWSVSRWER